MISMWKRVESNSLETELFDAFKFNSIRIQKTCHRRKLKLKLKFSRDFDVETSRVEFPRN